MVKKIDRYNGDNNKGFIYGETNMCISINNNQPFYANFKYMGNINLKNEGNKANTLLSAVADKKMDLIKEYLEPTGITITELIDRNAYASLCQLLDAYLLEAVRNCRQTCVSGSFSFDDMANFAIWIKNNFSDEIAGAFARRSDGNLYWDEQVCELIKIWYENYR